MGRAKSRPARYADPRRTRVGGKIRRRAQGAGGAGVVDLLEQHPGGLLGHLADGVAHRGECGAFGDPEVVVPDEGDVVGHPLAGGLEHRQRAGRHQVATCIPAPSARP